MADLPPNPMAAAPPEALELTLSDLLIGFDGKPWLAVPRFAVRNGAPCLITGPSGAGKSVFLRVLLGLAPPESVLGGRFELTRGASRLQLDYAGWRALSWLREGTAVVFQDAFHSLHPYRAIEEQCPAPVTAWRRFKLDPDRFLSRGYREAQGDPHAAHSPLEPRFVRDCSGGECQRISLLFPLLDAFRRLVVLDEPLTDIDLISRSSVRASIDPLLHDPGRAVVLVSHETDWLATNTLQHYALQVDASGMPRRLEHRGLGPPPRPAPAAPRPASMAAAPPAGPPVLRLRLQRPFRPGGDGFQLWPGGGLEVGAGGALGLIGESGSGKSTLLRAAAGLMPPRAYRGGVDVHLADGQGFVPVMSLSRRCRYGRIQYVSQDSSGSLLGGERVGAHLNWICRHKRAAPASFLGLVQRFGEALGLFADAAAAATFRRLRHRNLSMGQKRRYGLLRALLLLDIHQSGDAGTPKVLLLDEVSRGLDGDNLDRLLAAVQMMRAEFNIAVLAVSHDLDFVIRLCDELRLLYRGAVLPSPLRPSAAPGLTVCPVNGNPPGQPLNPYYHWFLRAEEVPDHLLVAPADRNRVGLADYRGCLLRRDVKCPPEQTGHVGCCHALLANSQPQGMVGICC